MRSLVAAAIAEVMAQPAHAAQATRLLYSSDWVGADTIYSVDLRAAQPATGQLTAPRQRSCPKTPFGAVDPKPSPSTAASLSPTARVRLVPFEALE